MKRIEDERVQFYLKHREQIEEWAAISKEVSKVAHRFLKSMSSDLKELARRHDAHPWQEHDSSYPKLFLVRRGWLATAETPRTAVGLQWHSKKVRFHSEPPYVGVWVNLDLDEGASLQDKLKASLAPVRANTGYRMDKWWPAWKHVRPSDDQAFWDDLNPYRQVLVEAADTAWWQFADTIDSVLGV